MDTTRTINRNTTNRSNYLPNISVSQTLSYAQRYQHMAKIANYNEMNEGQIWKQYQKLRVCLKELNEQVLHHMEKKAGTNLYAKQTPVTASVQATLTLLQEQKKTNEGRLQIFLNQAANLEQRVQHLTNKTEYLQDVNNEIEITEAKIKQITLQNKDMRRKQKLASKDLLSGSSFLQKLVTQQEMLHYAKKKYDKYEQIFKEAQAKVRNFNQKTAEFQTVLENRVSQFKQQEGYVVEEQNLQKFEQLQQIKQNLAKYQTVYKRNYLMKLKQLENLVNSNSRHEQVVQETEANNRAMRSEIDQISSLVVKSRRKSSMSLVQPRTGRKSTGLDQSKSGLSQQNIEIPNNRESDDRRNDKNRPLLPRN